MTFPLHANPPEVLNEVLARSQELGPRGVVVFDLDSTLFDNRPRQVMILREFGEHKGVPVLEANRVEHWDSGWDMHGAMVNAGLTHVQADALMPHAKEFWRLRFFTSEYAEHDVETAGAADFLRALVPTKVQIAYVTGRHEEMREGTVKAMQKCGMPLPDDKTVRLIMKPDLEESDDAFKVRAVKEVNALGQVVAAFDNEPTHANGYRQSFPDAKIVHLATDHSGRPVALLDGIVSIPDFRR
ncbi:MAG: hypothetical protein JST54_34175 [Deltaproteobacteria bacterium]|nr:hypothetical protein [Deltaproteobacteria bacterium]